MWLLASHCLSGTSHESLIFTNRIGRAPNVTDTRQSLHKTRGDVARCIPPVRHRSRHPTPPARPTRPARAGQPPRGKRRRHGRSQDTTQGRRAARAGSGRDTTQRGVTKCTLLQHGCKIARSCKNHIGGRAFWGKQATLEHWGPESVIQ